MQGTAHARDARGNTPLHHAAATPGQSRLVQQLLQQGADPNAVGSYGTRPLTSALWECQTRSASLLRAHGAVPEVGPLNEPSARSYLASVLGVSGVTVCNGVFLELMGALEAGVYPLLAHSWEHFSVQAGLDPALAWPVLRALQAAVPRACGPVAAVQAALAAGEVVIMPTGWRGHSVGAVFCGAAGALILANRAVPHTWRLLRAPKGWRLRAMVAFLQASRRRSAAAGEWRMGWFNRIYRAPNNAPLQARLAACRLKTQHVGNCAIASGKAAVLAALLCLAEPEKARTVYKAFTAFLRYHTLKNYLQQHAAADAAPMDAGLVDRCFAALQAGGRMQPTWCAELHAARNQVP